MVTFARTGDGHGHIGKSVGVRIRHGGRDGSDAVGAPLRMRLRQDEDRQLRVAQRPLERPLVDLVGHPLVRAHDPDCGTALVDPVMAPRPTNLNVIAIPRPLKSQRFQNTAFFADGRYTLTVDVIDGVRCVGYNLPSHDVYSWDAASLCRHHRFHVRRRLLRRSRWHQHLYLCAAAGSDDLDVAAGPDRGGIAHVAGQEQAVRGLGHLALAPRAVASLDLDAAQFGGPEPARRVAPRRSAEHQPAPVASPRTRSRSCCRTGHRERRRAGCRVRMPARCTTSDRQRARDPTDRPPPAAP